MVAPGAPLTHAVGMPGSSTSDIWRRTCSGALSSYAQCAQEWWCRRAQAEGWHRGEEEKGRRVALPSRARGRGPVTGAEADVDNHFQDATRREGFYFCNASLLRSILKCTLMWSVGDGCIMHSSAPIAYLKSFCVWNPLLGSA
jgi:hypothetical protein